MEERIIYSRLSTDGTITALVGNRIYPVLPNQDALLPLLVYTRLATEPTLHLQGKTKPDRVEVLVEAWTENFDTLADLLAKVKTNLHGFRGTVAGVQVQGCFLQDQNTEEEETGYHGTQTYWLYTE
jgi:hypothetical protein